MTNRVIVRQELELKYERENARDLISKCLADFNKASKLLKRTVYNRKVCRDELNKIKTIEDRINLKLFDAQTDIDDSVRCQIYLNITYVDIVEKELVLLRNTTTRSIEKILFLQ